MVLLLFSNAPPLKYYDLSPPMPTPHTPQKVRSSKMIKKMEKVIEFYTCRINNMELIIKNTLTLHYFHRANIVIQKFTSIKNRGAEI